MGILSYLLDCHMQVDFIMTPYSSNGVFILSFYLFMKYVNYALFTSWDN